MMIGRTMEELSVGDVAEVTHTVTDDTIREFVAASGDKNPIHSDQEFAAGTRFGRVIAPGMLTGSFVSGVIGTLLPGPGAIYLSQEFRFLRPVHVGDRVTARVEVAERLVERNRLRLLTTCRNQDGEALLEGEAWVLPSRHHIRYEGRREAKTASGGASSRAPGALYTVPATLGLGVLSLWMASSAALADRILRPYAPGTRAGREPDAVRPRCPEPEVR